jgi:hypothetical protein
MPTFFLNILTVKESWSVNDSSKSRGSDSKRRGHETRHMHRDQEYITSSSYEFDKKINREYKFSGTIVRIRNTLKIIRIIPHPTTLVKPHITQSLPETRNMFSTSVASDKSDTVIVCPLKPCLHRDQEYIRVTGSIRVHIRKENKSRQQIVWDPSKKQFKDERIIPQVKLHIIQSLPETRNMLSEGFLCCDDPC